MFRGQCHFHVSASNGVCLYLCWSVGLDSPDVLLFTDADQFSTAGLNLSSPTGSLSECVHMCVFMCVWVFVCLLVIVGACVWLSITSTWPQKPGAGLFCPRSYPHI